MRTKDQFGWLGRDKTIHEKRGFPKYGMPLSFLEMLFFKKIILKITRQCYF
jgi:hypothetical protein